MNSNITTQEINIGIDTGKHQLDIYIRPLDIYFTVSNDERGIKQAINKIKTYSPTRIIVESTGRLEQRFVLSCSEAGLKVSVVNPLHIKRFAGAIGQLAKTDKLDAKLIAHYGEAVKPKATQLKAKEARLMSDLLSRRRDLMEMQTMEKNRLQRLPASVANTIKPVLTTIKKQIEKLEKKLQQLIEKNESYQDKAALLQSVPGIGDVVVFNILSDMPELGTMSNKQAAALVGVAPMNRESGQYQGKRMIRGGRAQLRTVLYMAMMSSIQCNAKFKAMYHHLLAKGKPKKVAIIACIRKLVVVLNSMLRNNTMWSEKMV